MKMDGVKPPVSRPRLTLRAERADATRRRIAAAARLLFARDGYAATTLKAVADEAGVAVQTVYAVHGSKAGILRDLRVVAVSQPEADLTVREAVRQTTPSRALDLFARSIRLRWELAGDIVAIHHDAAMSDPSVRPEVDAVLAIRRNGIAAFAGSVGPGLRPSMTVTRAAAVIDALTLYELYAELVDVHGWSADDYETWLARALRSELLTR